MFSLQQNWRTRWQNRFCPEVKVGRGRSQTMYIHMIKCKTIKEKKEKRRQ
jgi:hypothetical protein